MNLRSQNPETELYFATVNYHEKVNALARVGPIQADPFGYGHEEFNRKTKEYDEAKERLRLASKSVYSFFNDVKASQCQCQSEGAK
jgi:hypothetical protein